MTNLILKKLEWLGLFNDKKIQIGNASIFDMFAHILQEKLVYNTGEQDLLVQYHKFIASYPDGRKEKITSTMIDTGLDLEALFGLYMGINDFFDNYIPFNSAYDVGAHEQHEITGKGNTNGVNIEYLIYPNPSSACVDSV